MVNYDCGRTGCKLDRRGRKVGVKESQPALSSSQKLCTRKVTDAHPVTFQIRALSNAGSFGWDEPIKDQLKGILDKTKFAATPG